MTNGTGGQYDPNRRPNQNPYGQPSSAPYLSAHGQNPYGTVTTRPPSHLGWAIVTTIFGFLPLGIVSIVKATSVSKRWAAGDVVGARRASDSAKNFAIASAAIGVVSVALWAALVAVGIGGLSLRGSDNGSDAGGYPATTVTSQYPTMSPPPTTSAVPPATTAAAAKFDVCVLNAGTVTGLTTQYQQRFVAAGYVVSETGNLASQSIAENTIFYDGPDQEAQAKSMASVVSTSLTERPDQFTKCPGAIAVVVVN